MGIIQITQAEYDELVHSKQFLVCLLSEGLAGWEGFKNALRVYSESDEAQDDE